MNTRLIPIAACLLLFAGCGSKKKATDSRFIPVLSLIEEQVKHVDTSLYSIRKIIFKDSLPNDTLYIPREQFRQAAHDFLSIPDISASNYADRYTETNDFDQELNRVLILYLPKKPEKEEIQRQELLIKPGSNRSEEDKVTNIIINTIVTTKDSSVEKKMLWTIDKSFQVTTISLQKNGIEKTATCKIVWNEAEQE